jgi:alkanesulfonate monooxygenase SsuD/methylene tetrahydromethanopterin reductase-like flavin-dependent oxidoreductase (luciferase family)
MKLGAVTLQNRPWPELRESWRRLDELGLESLWVADHLANPLRPERPWLDGWTLLPALALETRGARVGALVSSLTLRRPATLVKAAVTLDHITGGRAELALGAGGSGRDTELAGEPSETFTARVERTLALLADESLQPRPVQPRIPITIGGHGDEALELAARHAGRWNSYGGRGLEPEEALTRARERNERLSALCEGAGRDPTTLTRSILLGYPFVRETPWRSEEAFRDVVDRWHVAGFDELIVYYPPETGMPPGSVDATVFESVVRAQAAPGPGGSHAGSQPSR